VASERQRQQYGSAAAAKAAAVLSRGGSPASVVPVPAPEGPVATPPAEAAVGGRWLETLTTAAAAAAAAGGGGGGGSGESPSAALGVVQHR
jgi:hypothetical protein